MTILGGGGQGQGEGGNPLLSKKSCYQFYSLPYFNRTKKLVLLGCLRWLQHRERDYKSYDCEYKNIWEHPQVRS
jgi:hypothetical protein